MLNGLYEADQAQESKKELAGNQTKELTGSDPLLSSRSYPGRTAGWVDEKADYPGRDSGPPELDGGQCAELAANRKSAECSCHDINDRSVHSTKQSMSGSLQQRSSPELHHPINSVPDRESLYQNYQKRRGTPASHRRSNADPYRSDWALVGATENPTSRSSCRQSKSRGSLHHIPTGGKEIPSSNAYNVHGDAHPISHEVSPEDPAPTTNYPLTNAVSPSSPNAALASLPPNVLSPVSPMFEDEHPPLTVASSTTISYHGSSPRSLEHQEENATDQTSLSPSPLQSMPKEPKNKFLLFDSRDWDSRSPLPIYGGLESTVPIARQTTNSISQFSLPAVQSPYQSGKMVVPSVSTQPHHWRIAPSDLEALIQSNGSGNTLEESGVTQVYTPQSGTSRFSPIALPSTSPPQSSRTQADSQCANNIQSPLEPMQPSTTFHMQPFSGIVTRPLMDIVDVGNSATGTPNLAQSDAGQSFCFPELQPWIPLDHFRATNVYDLHSTGPDLYSDDQCPQAALQHHSRDFGPTHARWRPYCFHHNSSLVGRLPPKQDQIDEHLSLIREFNNEWMQRIKESQPGLWSLCSTLSASDLFDRAVRTGKSFIRGNLIERFEDVFAFMHLAFAAAFSGTWQQDDYFFSALRDDALQWQHVLLSDEDQNRFLNAMDCWRLHELEPPPLFASPGHTNTPSSTPQKSLYCGDQQILWDALRKGEVFKAFIAFVDSEWISSSFMT